MTAQNGYRAASALNLGLIGVAALLLVARGPNAGDRWIGWRGGFRPVRSQPTPDVERKPDDVDRKPKIDAPEHSPPLAGEKASAA